jgi:hypothetical protein
MAADPQGGSTTPTTGARAPARYLLVAAALVLAYLVVVPVLWQQRGVVEDGPLSFRAPALTTALMPGQSPGRLEQACARQEPFSSLDYQRMKVVGGRMDGRVYYGCYAVATDGAVRGAAVLDPDLLLVRDVALLKRSGAWRWIGGVKTELEAALGCSASSACTCCITGGLDPARGPARAGSGGRDPAPTSPSACCRASAGC